MVASGGGPLQWSQRLNKTRSAFLDLKSRCIHETFLFVTSAYIGQQQRLFSCFVSEYCHVSDIWYGEWSRRLPEQSSPSAKQNFSQHKPTLQTTDYKLRLPPTPAQHFTIQHIINSSNISKNEISNLCERLLMIYIL